MKCAGRYCRIPPEIVHEGTPFCPTHHAELLDARMMAMTAALHDGRLNG
jgi:hypothetical protein